MSALTVGSLFSGIGGIDLAAQWAGFETAWFVEKEPFPQQVLRKHWPGVPVYGDIFECHDLPYVDVIVGGFPCQPFSVAGKRQGADDERFLLPEMLRIIREVKPYAVLFENVPGFPSLNDGAEFKYLLRSLAEMGFDAEWGHLRASDCGAPHQRERWFCVGYAAYPRLAFSGRGYEPEGAQRWVVNDGRKGRDVADAEHDGHVTPTPQGSDGTAVFNGAQGTVSARQPARVGASRPVAYAKSTERQSAKYSRRGRAGLANNGKRLEDSNRFGRGYASQRHYALSVYRLAGSRDGAVRAVESLVGGNTNGVSSGLDFAGWPARPGEPQHDYEPPRVTSGRTPNRAARLKALGNAVVPQVVFPLFVAIREWLEEQMLAEAVNT